jgi:hypothetical protein
MGASQASEPFSRPVTRAQFTDVRFSETTFSRNITPWDLLARRGLRRPLCRLFLATRDERIQDEFIRAAYVMECRRTTIKQYKRQGLLLRTIKFQPDCRTCGLDTGCWCEMCSKGLCTLCDRQFQGLCGPCLKTLNPTVIAARQKHWRSFRENA